jgi:AcrR family transcriptional regulator
MASGLPDLDPFIAPQRVDRGDVELAEAVTRVFLRDGFAHLDFDSLARLVGATPGSLRRLSPHWDSLVELIVGRFLRSAAVRVDVRVTTVTGARAKMIAFLDALSIELAAVGERFYADLPTCPSGLSIYHAHTQRAGWRVQSMIGQGITDGEFRDVNSRFVAAVLVSVLTAVQRGELEMFATAAPTA